MGTTTWEVARETGPHAHFTSEHQYMSKSNPKVEAFFTGARMWRDEMDKLRGIVLNRPPTEE